MYGAARMRPAKGVLRLKQAKSKWMAVFSKYGAPKLRLICFPYAGGSAQVFKPWLDFLPDSMELCAVQLPGRSSRFTEPNFTALEPLVADLSREIRPFLDLPFVFFGHSLGAAVSFELCRTLGREGIAPEFLFVSGRNAPHQPRRRPPIHHLPDDEFKTELLDMNGTPQEILENQELMELMLPMLRADFTISETYKFQPGPALQCPLASFGGEKDPDVDEEGVSGWGEHTAAAFHWHMLPGDHFFLHQSREILLHRMVQHLAQGVLNRV